MLNYLSDVPVHSGFIRSVPSQFANIQGYEAVLFI